MRYWEAQRRAGDVFYKCVFIMLWTWAIVHKNKQNVFYFYKKQTSKKNYGGRKG